VAAARGVGAAAAPYAEASSSAAGACARKSGGRRLSCVSLFV
jgi:hypothetical protein